MMKKLALLLALFASPAWADSTINALSAGAAVSGTDLFPAYQGSNPAVKVTAAQIATFVGSAGSSVLRSYLAGVQLSNDVGTPNTVLDISAGTAADSTNASMISIGAFTKTTAGTWVAGTGNAGMGSGGGGLTVANSTWYHVCLATISAASDIFFDTDVACSTHKPTGTTAVRRIGSFFTNGSAQIVAFSQNGDEFLWLVPFLDVNGAAVTSTRSLLTVSVPTGVKVRVQIRAEAGTTFTNHFLISSPDETAAAAQATLGNSTGAVQVTGVFAFSGNSMIRTNTSAQLGVSSGAGETNAVYIATYGYIDTRGRDN